MSVEKPVDPVIDGGSSIEDTKESVSVAVDAVTVTDSAGAIEDAAPDEIDSNDIRHLLRKMAHDIRAPLGSVISTSEMLVGGFYDALTPKQSRAADRLLRSSKRTLAIIDDFITYLKAEVGEIELAYKAFDPRQSLIEWCAPIKTMAEEKGLTFEISTTTAVPAMLSGDTAMIQRVVTAPAWNSVAFTSEGSIHLMADWIDNQWTVTIEDTGQGIPAENIPHIFEAFWRGVDRPQMPTACVGLGLSVARALSRLMQGQFVLKETSDKGSVFRFQLPLNTVPLVPVPLKTDGTPEAETKPGTEVISDTTSDTRPDAPAGAAAATAGTNQV
ncbi:MAG TPA: HAMP domain-containing sensor histidine kinase [Phototrophicaceae bacterium]|nr:HAMP domain-containing sensor histidine kinase [Phototrophicaceae bacterium]